MNGNLATRDFTVSSLNSNFNPHQVLGIFIIYQGGNREFDTCVQKNKTSILTVFINIKGVLLSIFQNILCRKSKTVICLYIHIWHIYHFTSMFIAYLGIFLGLHNLTFQLLDKFTRTLTQLSKLLVVKLLTVERAPVSKCEEKRQKKSSNFKKFKSKMSFKLLQCMRNFNFLTPN